MVKRGDGYIARCIDWNLTVIRDTQKEAFEELNKEVILYYHTIADMGYPKHLLCRHAPLSVMLQYHYARIKRALSHRWRIIKNDDSCIVDMPIPLAA
jgi:hypothetical protein